MRGRRLLAPLTLVIAISAGLSGCLRSSGPADAPATRDRATLEAGRAIYNYRCYFCHGYSGDARTLAATYLSPPPRSFRDADLTMLPAARIAEAVSKGRDGTAMRPFASLLTQAEILAVAAFVEDEFVRRKAPNTAYHTEANGWPDHARHAEAFSFARGEIALDVPVESLTPSQQRGRQRYLSSCISCHDRGKPTAEAQEAWSSRPLSYPRAGFVYTPEGAGAVDALSGASVYARHDVAPKIETLAPAEQRGKQLYEANCAFCHAADGSGKHWIGRFMEPPARDLTALSAQQMPRERLMATIRDGLEGRSMPAWRDVLAADEIGDIADYVGRAFIRPAPRR